MNGRYIFHKVTFKGQRLWLNRHGAGSFGIFTSPSHIDEQPDGTGVLRSSNAPGSYGYALLLGNGLVVRFGKTLGKEDEVELGWPDPTLPEPEPDEQAPDVLVAVVDEVIKRRRKKDTTS